MGAPKAGACGMKQIRTIIAVLFASAGIAQVAQSQNSTMFGPQTILNGGASGPCGAPINGFNCQRSITLAHTSVPATQSNFTVLVCANGASPCNASVSGLNQSGGGAHVLNTTTSNGVTVPADLVFTSDSGCVTALNWDIEKY